MTATETLETPRLRRAAEGPEGGGEARARIQAMDWSNNPLGPPSGWPQSLRALVSLCLGAPFACCLRWGQARVLLYNDAYAALARPDPEAFASSRAGEGDDAAGALAACGVSVSHTPIRDEAGDVLGIFTALFANGAGRAESAAEAELESERAELLAREQAMRYQAEAASRTKDEFLAMLGHELRNPLAPISTALHLMRLRGGDLLARERTIIERQVNHLLRLVDDLLDVSRIARGKIQLKRRPVEISEIVAKAIEIASPLFEQRAHRLVTSLPSSALAIDGDEVRLAQVVANLLTNAAKYTEPGGRISVSAHAEADTVVLTVSDSGIGIGPELLPRVFDLFVQDQRGADRAGGGLGLGLSIVRNLVELHGGTVSAHSDGAGCGSDFVIRLPRAESAPAAVAAQAAADSLAYRPRRVLVVDDNRDAAETLAEALEACGYDVRVALDAPDALSSATEFRPSVALLDLGLPVMDGYELARRLADAMLLPPKLVAVSGYGQSSDRERTRSAGFDEHLIKPVELPALLEVLNRLVDQP